MNSVFGIANCDKVKKARAWLEARDIPYQFHDFRKDGLSADKVSRWYNIWHEAMINRRSTTWRQLTEKERRVTSDTEAVDLLVRYPTLIQRPVLESGEKVVIDFSDAQYEEFFK